MQADTCMWLKASWRSTTAEVVWANRSLIVGQPEGERLNIRYDRNFCSMFVSHFPYIVCMHMARLAPELY